MRSVVEIDTEKPEEIKEVVRYSFESDKNVEYSIKAEENSIEVETKTDGLGVLRGCTDTVFRLTTLAEKIYTKR